MIDDQIICHEDTVKTNNDKKKMNVQTINPKSKLIEA